MNLAHNYDEGLYYMRKVIKYALADAPIWGNIRKKDTMWLMGIHTYLVVWELNDIDFYSIDNNSVLWFDGTVE